MHGRDERTDALVILRAAQDHVDSPGNPGDFRQCSEPLAPGASPCDPWTLGYPRGTRPRSTGRGHVSGRIVAGDTSTQTITGLTRKRVWIAVNVRASRPCSRRK